MPLTANRSYPYPARSGTPGHGWKDLQRLAEALDLDVAGLVADIANLDSLLLNNILGPWTDFTPIVYTNMGTTPSAISPANLDVQYARYRKVGRTVDAIASVTVNATTTNGAGISLPFTASTRFFNCGTLAVMGPGTLPSDQSGIAYMFTDLATLVVVAYTNGFRNVQTSGQQLRYSVRYEAAS